MLEWSAELARKANERKRPDTGIEAILDEANALQGRLCGLRATTLVTLQAKARVWLASAPLPLDPCDTSRLR